MKRACQRQGSEMTTVPLVFLTLLAWMGSSDTWLGSERWAELSRCEGAKNSGASRKNAVICDTTKLSRQRSSEISGERITKDHSLCVLFDGCVNVLQRAEETVNAETDNRRAGKSKSLQLVAYFLSKTRCLLLKTEVTSDNHGTSLSQPLSSTARCARAPVLVFQWKTKDCGCIREVCDFEVALPQRPVAVPSDNQMPLVLYSTPAGCVGGVQPADTDRWVGRFCLAAVLLLSAYTRITQLCVGPARDSNSTIGMLFTLTLRRFSPPVTVFQQPEWSIMAVCLSCALGRTVHVLIACRAAHTVMKRFRPAQQHFRTLPVTVLFLWLILCSPFARFKNVSRDVLCVESAQRSCVSAHIELLATLCCLFVSLISLLRSVTKLNVLSVLFHVQLVTSLQNSVVPRKYILIIKISRFI